MKVTDVNGGYDYTYGCIQCHLTTHLKIIKMVNFTLCAFCHDEENRKK